MRSCREQSASRHISPEVGGRGPMGWEPAMYQPLVKEARRIYASPRGVNHSRPTLSLTHNDYDVSNKEAYIVIPECCCHLLSHPRYAT